MPAVKKSWHVDTEPRRRRQRRRRSKVEAGHPLVGWGLLCNVQLIACSEEELACERRRELRRGRKERRKRKRKRKRKEKMMKVNKQCIA